MERNFKHAQCQEKKKIGAKQAWSFSQDDV
jgi:hypothetical protein